ncbi:MAG: PP2C family protein-serine/threonine phosphatase [Planctomycetota bacterium]
MTDTSEFRREFEVQTHRLVQRRLIWFICVWGGIGVLLNIPAFLEKGLQAVGGLPSFLSWMQVVLPDWGQGDFPKYAAAFTIWIGAYGAALIGLLTARIPTKRVVQLSMALITVDGLMAVFARAIDVPMLAPVPDGVVLFFFSHLIASLIFPWSAKQAIWPAAIVLGASAGSKFTFELDGEAIERVVEVAFSPIAVVPGILVCFARHTRRVEKFGYSFVRQRYGRLRADLTSARMIHESVFPKPRMKGHVCLNYRYEPMRQIGGDYVFSSVTPSEDGRGERLSLVLMDVTGHGIAAALSVNRLHGEIELIFADDPAAAPGEVLRRLNRYVQLTLAKHSVYVTAICIRVDSSEGTIEHASGGHPPAFLRAIDGTMAELDSTATMLGAVPDEYFDPAPQTHVFGPGDSVVAYTDGATEARCPDGKMLRIAGLRQILSTKEKIDPGAWPQKLIEHVVNYRGGLAPEDDTLLVEVFRPLQAPAEPPESSDFSAAPAPSPLNLDPAEDE